MSLLANHLLQHRRLYSTRQQARTNDKARRAVDIQRARQCAVFLDLLQGLCISHVLDQARVIHSKPGAECFDRCITDLRQLKQRFMKGHILALALGCQRRLGP